MKKAVAFFGLIICYASCDTSEVISLPTNPRRLVVNSFGQTEEVWKATVSLSRGILNDFDDSTVSNANVTIYENGKFMETLTKTPGGYNENAFLAKTSFPKAGRTYRIQVDAEPYESIFAEYIQPYPVDIDTLETQILGKRSEYGFELRDVQFRLSFDDPSEENFYEISIVVETDWIQTGYNSFAKAGGPIMLNFVDPLYSENNQIFDQSAMVADSYFNGKKAVIDFKSTLDEFPEFPPLRFVTVYLRNVTKEYYLYKKTSNLQRINRGDPFAQPVQVENNIQNGFGIFAGYSQTTKKINFNL